MRISVALLVVLLLAWVGGSVWYYTCRMEQQCPSTPFGRAKKPQKLLVEMEGYDTRTFYLSHSSDGTLEFLPGEAGGGFGDVRLFLDESPDHYLDLITANDAQASGLQAMLILSGIPGRKIRVHTDPSLGSADKPLRLVGNRVPVTETAPGNNGDIAPGKQEREADPAPTAIPVEIAPKPEPEPARPACPAVSAGRYAPEIGPIFFDPDDVSLRCAASLGKFARAALPAMDSLPGLRLHVTGFANDGTAYGNTLRTGLLRAAEVKKYLIKQGLPGQRIDTYSRDSGPETVQEGSEVLLPRRVHLEWQLE